MNFFKSKKNSVIIVLAVLIAVRLVIVFIEYQKRNAVDESDIHEPAILSQVEPVNPDVNVSKVPEEAMTEQNNSLKGAVCQTMRSHYQNLDDVKKVEKVSVRFVNIHKKVDGIVYRLRFFYKDSSENEIPTYLLYKEDQNDEENLIEKSPYKKGAQYQKIEKSAGTIVYTEEGVNIGVDQDLFLHYENKVLKDLQGVSPLHDEKDFMECRF